MKVSDFIVDFLIQKGVADVFGIPGGVILDFLNSIDCRKDQIVAHLNYHEQAAAFAACGYAQSSGRLAVAYSTRGPGVTNMITGIADGFYDSLPILFIAAHSHVSIIDNIRIEENQEFDTLKMLSSITKYAARIENVKNVRYELEKSCHIALSGRPGPVFLDFLASVLNDNMSTADQCTYIINDSNKNFQVADYIKNELEKSQRPILLIGDGIHQSALEEYVQKLALKINIPVLSSRFSQDIMPHYDHYYGYIGSHATRYSNFILSKCDLIIALGNRLMFKPDSQSFASIVHNAKIIRIDEDENEFRREIQNSVCIRSDLKELLPLLIDHVISWKDIKGWFAVCDEIRSKLHGCDTDYPVNLIAKILMSTENSSVITSDVGNNEFWLSRAYALSNVSNRVLYSKSFGALGCSLPKAIGAYYATRKRVFCFTGDQGFQMNIQELQFIANKNLPITIILINNFSSGMIRNEQKKRFSSHFVSTTLDSGYSTPNFKKIANAFGINFFSYKTKDDWDNFKFLVDLDVPNIIEIITDENTEVFPYLPKGNPCQKFIPEINAMLYKQLNQL
jgi:acetolactate synthase-1/2/3 large subunit